VPEPFEPYSLEDQTPADIIEDLRAAESSGRIRHLTALVEFSDDEVSLWSTPRSLYELIGALFVTAYHQCRGTEDE
jgi:hypothetical protein